MLVVLPLSRPFFRVTRVGTHRRESSGDRRCLSNLGRDVHSGLVKVYILGSLAFEAILVRPDLGACTRRSGPLRRTWVPHRLVLGTCTNLLLDPGYTLFVLLV